MSREFIAQKLQELRIKSGLTADEVGKKIGKSGKTVNAWEHNHGQPDAETLIALCDIYDVEDILMEFREEKPSSAIFHLNEHEQELVVAYRKHPAMQDAVDKLLGIDSASQNHTEEKRA